MRNAEFASRHSRQPCSLNYRLVSPRKGRDERRRFNQLLAITYVYLARICSNIIYCSILLSENFIYFREKFKLVVQDLQLFKTGLSFRGSFEKLMEARRKIEIRTWLIVTRMRFTIDRAHVDRQQHVIRRFCVVCTTQLSFIAVPSFMHRSVFPFEADV